MFKQKNTSISIIIPVYNTSLYLEQCLNSILNQSFKDYEVICVDDGSSDNSLEILKKYEKISDKIKIISQKNQGVSAARNAGLDNSTGEYIAFLDSDDFIEPNYLERLYNESRSSGADVVICNFYRYYDSYNLKIPVIYKKQQGIYTTDEILKALIPDNLIHFYLWNKLWKKELFNNIRFPNIKYEDVSILCKVIYKAKKISIINDALYYYRIRKTSIVRNYSIETQNDYVRAYGFIRVFLEDNNLYKKYKFYYTLLSIKVFLVMFCVNFLLITQYKSLSITIDNFKSCFNFINNTNSENFRCSENDLLSIDVLKSATNSCKNKKENTV